MTYLLVADDNACTLIDPVIKEIDKLVKHWQGYIGSNFYECTDDIFLSLAEFISESIKKYCKKIPYYI